MTLGEKYFLITCGGIFSTNILGDCCSLAARDGGITLPSLSLRIGLLLIALSGVAVALFSELSV